MAKNQTRKPAPKTAAARGTAARSANGKPKAAAAAKAPAATSRAKPAAAAKSASKALPFPAIVTLKHFAEWASANHSVPKKQAIAMFNDFVADIGRVLKGGSKIRIPNLGILQVRLRPARPARKGRNPATGEEIQIKASKASKKVAFRAAKALNETI